MCNKDPGRDVDVYFTCAVRTMVDIWMGELSYKKAVKEDLLKAVGPSAYKRNIFSWMDRSIFADLPPAQEI
jgi:hypothetical protein